MNNYLLLLIINIINVCFSNTQFNNDNSRLFSNHRFENDSYNIEEETDLDKNKNRKSNIDSILEKINNDKSEMLYTTITKEGKVIAAVGLSLILIVNGITTLNTKNNKKVTKNVINNERLDNYREVNVLNRNYLVSKDDTLESIAIETNTSVEMIKELNGLDTDELVPGESLYIPYAISSEDLDDYTQIIDVKNMTINEIADAYNTDIETLISLNDEAIIQSGDDLIILSDTLVVPDFEEKDKNKNKSLSY